MAMTLAHVTNVILVSDTMMLPHAVIAGLVSGTAMTLPHVAMVILVPAIMVLVLAILLLVSDVEVALPMVVNGVAT